MQTRRRGSSFSYAMASTQGEAATRRNYLATSATLALVSSAAKRRIHGLDLDEHEANAVEKARASLQAGAESIRNGSQQSQSEVMYAFTHAFASRATPTSHATRPNLDPDAQVAALERVVHLLTLVLDASEPLKEAEGAEVVELFGALSGDFLSHVARAGETVGGRSA